MDNDYQYSRHSDHDPDQNHYSNHDVVYESRTDYDERHVDDRNDVTGDGDDQNVEVGGGAYNDGTSKNSFRGGAAKIKFRVRQPSTGKFTHIGGGGGDVIGGGDVGVGGGGGDAVVRNGNRVVKSTTTTAATIPQKSWDIVRMLTNPFLRNAGHK